MGLGCLTCSGSVETSGTLGEELDAFYTAGCTWACGVDPKCAPEGRFGDLAPSAVSRGGVFGRQLEYEHSHDCIDLFINIWINGLWTRGCHGNECSLLSVSSPNELLS